MASHVYVLDVSLKRTQIKVTPATPLSDVLVEACRKFNLKPDQYTLKHNEKSIDLSRSFRLSSLPSGAKLQLVQASRSPSVVSVALALPPSENAPRLQDRFPSSTPLWLVLRKFEDANKLNLTERSAPSTESGQGYLCYLQPCMNIMGRELSNFLDLQKTLAQLGYNNGSVLVRLEYKNEGVRMEEAKAQISTYLQDVSSAASQTASAHGAHAQPDVQLTSVPDASADNAQAPRDGPADQDPSGDTIMTPAPPSPTPALHPVQDDGVIASSSETNPPSTESQFPSLNPGISIYSAPAANTPVAATEAFNEADYHPSVEHAQVHQAILNRSAQNKRLQSDKELEDARASRKASLAEIKSVPLRIRLPDQMQIGMDVGQEDTSISLYARVRDMLANSSLGFRLRYPGPKGLPITFDPENSAKLITGLGITGPVVVTMVWDDSVSPDARKGHVLKEDLRGQAQVLKVQSPRVDQDSVDTKAAAAPKQDDSKKRAASKGGDVEAKMKKFLGLGKR